MATHQPLPILHIAAPPPGAIPIASLSSACAASPLPMPCTTMSPPTTVNNAGAQTRAFAIPTFASLPVFPMNVQLANNYTAEAPHTAWTSSPPPTEGHSYSSQCHSTLHPTDNMTRVAHISAPGSLRLHDDDSNCSKPVDFYNDIIFSGGVPMTITHSKGNSHIIFNSFNSNIAKLNESSSAPPSCCTNNNSSSFSSVDNNPSPCSQLGASPMPSLPAGFCPPPVVKGDRWRVSVRSKRDVVNVYSSFKVDVGDHVIIEADRGEHIGVVETATEAQLTFDIPCQLLRKASEAEIAQLNVLRQREQDSTAVILKHASRLNAQIDIIDVEFQLDGKKLTVFFQSSTVLDFRRLQRRLFSKFKCRIWLKNVQDVSRDALAPPPSVSKQIDC